MYVVTASAVIIVSENSASGKTKAIVTAVVQTADTLHDGRW